MSFGFGIGDFIAVITLAQKIRDEFQDAPKQYAAISKDVNRLRIVLEYAENELSVPDLNAKQKNELKEIIDGCRDVLKDLQQMLSKYGKLGSDPRGLGEKMKILWKRVRWDQKDINELRSRITTNVAFLDLFTRNKIQEVKSSADQFYKKQDIRELNEESSKILNWLSRINHTPQQQDYIKKRQQGTGKWLLESQKFNTWVASDKQILFCPGIPGAGKTILTSIVVEELTNRFENDKSIGIAYLYCNFRRKHEQNVDDLVSCLLKQLAQRLPSLPDAVKDLHKRHSYKGTSPSLEDLLQTLQSVTAIYSKVFIFVDALDECQDMKFLSQILNLQARCQLSFFATSRHVPEICKKFDQSTWLEIRASDEDVERYLDGHMSQISRYVYEKPDLQGEIKTAIINAVDGMFLLAQLHLNSLRGKTSPKKIQQALQKLPTGSDAYDSAYTEAMERIEGQLEDEKELAKQVLSWITCAKRPLTTVELQQAIAVEIDEPELDKENFAAIDQMVSVCAGLVTVDEESNVIGLVHYTTQEYFNRKQNYWFPDAETYITTICVTYLSFNTFEVFCSEKRVFKERLYLYPFVEYAARNWGHHARKASISNQALAQAVMKFLNSESKVNTAWKTLWAFSYLPDRFIQLEVSRTTEMHLAAYFGAENIVQLLLDRVEVEIDSKYSGTTNPLSWNPTTGRTPFSYAAENGHEEVVKLLLGTGKVDINSKAAQDFGQTPLSYAAKNGHEGIVKLLLDTGKVEINTFNGFNQTPFYLAVYNDHGKVLKLLLDTGKVDIDYPDRDGRTQFSYAAQSGNIEVLKLLLDIGKVDIDRPDSVNRTPFSYVAQSGNTEVLKLLLNAGKVDIDRPDSVNRIPLSYAAHFGSKEILKLFFDTGKVDIDRPNLNGRTPFSYITHYSSKEIIKLLLDTGKVDIDRPDLNGRTPFSYAAQFGDEEVLKLLLDTGKIDIDRPDLDGRTPFSCAAQFNGKEVLKLLLDTGKIDINSRDTRRRTPLSFATMMKNTRAVELLLDTCKAEIDQKDIYGRTPLYLAVHMRNIAIVKLLVKRGASLELDLRTSKRLKNLIPGIESGYGDMRRDI